MSQLKKAELVQKIHNLDGLSTEEKSALLELLNTRKKYGLVWEEKPEDVEIELAEKLPILKEVEEKRIVGESEDSPNHILIEGDNLHALTALQYTHAGKIDVIYIDPPYNRGENDFKYNDKYVDKEDSYRHSKWLSFMHKRLTLAKHLLKDGGIFFASIDDNEQAQFRILLDDIFGQGNFVANFIWEKRTNRENRKEVSVRHDYVLCFVKTRIRPKALHQLPMSGKALANYKNPDNDPRGPWKSDPATAQAGHATPSQFYTLIAPNGKEHQLESGRCWLYTEPVMAEAIADNRIWFGKDGNAVPRLKTYLHAKERGLTPESILFAKDVTTTESAKNKLKQVFGGESKFETPKPVSLINMLLQMSASSDSIILDFFAGAGTTLHSVMELNNTDGGSRSCIIVTNNENRICEEVTYERNKKIIEGYEFSGKEEKVLFEAKLSYASLKKIEKTLDEAQKIIDEESENFTKIQKKVEDNTLKIIGINQYSDFKDGLKNNTLRYYQTDFINREPSMKNKRDLVKASTDLLCIKEDCYTPIAEHTSNKVKVFESPEFYMIVAITDDAIDDVISIIESTEKVCKVYIFAPAAYPHTAEFEEELSPSDFARTKLCALPEAIYRAYQSVLREVDRKMSQTIIVDDEVEGQPNVEA